MDRQLRTRLLERRVDPTQRAVAAKPKEKKKRKVDVIETALERFRNEEVPSLSRCVAFSSRFCPPTSPSHSNSSRADDSDDDVDDTDGESCPVDELSRSPSRKEDNARRGRLRIQVGVALAQGARAYMEDRYSIVENLFEDETINSLDDDEMMLDHDPASGVPMITTTSPSLFAIYDGHNGAFAADYARDRFRELLSESEVLREVNRRARRGPMCAEDVAKVRELLVEAFETVDDEIVTRTVRMSKRDGSTVLLGLLVGGKLFVANIGDSRGVFSRASSGDFHEDEDHDAIRVSVDHKPDCAKETARVEAAGGKIVYSGCWRVAHDRVPLRLAISRSLGDHPLKVNLPESCSAPLVSVEPDITVVDVASAQNELMVFASDGLWDRLSDNEAVRLARAKVAEFDADDDDGDSSSPSSESLRYAASALIKDALNKRSMDNITAMVVSWSAMP